VVPRCWKSQREGAGIRRDLEEPAARTGAQRKYRQLLAPRYENQTGDEPGFSCCGAARCGRALRRGGEQGSSWSHAGGPGGCHPPLPTPWWAAKPPGTHRRCRDAGLGKLSSFLQASWRRRCRWGAGGEVLGAPQWGGGCSCGPGVRRGLGGESPCAICSQAGREEDSAWLCRDLTGAKTPSPPASLLLFMPRRSSWPRVQSRGRAGSEVRGRINLFLARSWLLREAGGGDCLLWALIPGPDGFTGRWVPSRRVPSVGGSEGARRPQRPRRRGPGAFCGCWSAREILLGDRCCCQQEPRKKERKKGRASAEKAGGKPPPLPCPDQTRLSRSSRAGRARGQMDGVGARSCN